MARQLIITLAILAALAGAGFAHRSYRTKKIDRMTLAWAEWVKVEMIKKYDLSILDAFGSREPNWLGETGNFLVLITPSGRTLVVSMVVNSTIFDTRSKTRLDLDRKPVELPVDALKFGEPVDLIALVPTAFPDKKATHRR